MLSDIAFGVFGVVLFGDGGETFGWIGGISGLLVGLGSLITMIMSTRHKNRMESRAADGTDKDAVIAFLKGEVAQRDTTIAAKDKAIESIRQMHAECREESITLRADLVRLFDWIHGVHPLLKAKGIEYVEPPTITPTPNSQARTEQEAARRVAQDKVLEQALLPPEAGGSHANPAD